VRCRSSGKISRPRASRWETGSRASVGCGREPAPAAKARRSSTTTVGSRGATRSPSIPCSGSARAGTTRIGRCSTRSPTRRPTAGARPCFDATSAGGGARHVGGAGLVAPGRQVGYRKTRWGAGSGAESSRDLAEMRRRGGRPAGCSLGLA
jgi:hypothetical protein